MLSEAIVYVCVYHNDTDTQILVLSPCAGRLPLSSWVEHIYMLKEKTTVYPVIEAKILKLHQTFLLILYIQSIFGVRKGRILIVIHTGGPWHCSFCWPISIENVRILVDEKMRIGLRVAFIYFWPGALRRKRAEKPPKWIE